MAKSRRVTLIEQGVDPRVASRSSYPIVKNVDGKNCRDREPWGGFTDPERCDCVGQCKYDSERKE